MKYFKICRKVTNMIHYINILSPRAPPLVHTISFLFYLSSAEDHVPTKKYFPKDGVV